MSQTPKRSDPFHLKTVFRLLALATAIFIMICLIFIIALIAWNVSDSVTSTSTGPTSPASPASPVSPTSPLPTGWTASPPYGTFSSIPEPLSQNSTPQIVSGPPSARSHEAQANQNHTDTSTTTDDFDAKLHEAIQYLAQGPSSRPPHNPVRPVVPFQASVTSDVPSGDSGHDQEFFESSMEDLEQGGPVGEDYAEAEDKPETV